MFAQPMRRGVGLILPFLAVLGCSGRTSKAPPSPPAETTITVFALAEVRGQIEPCGCTTDPLGDLARTAELVAAARAEHPVVVIDAGSLLYPRATIDPPGPAAGGPEGRSPGARL
jgi:2',3'-cyclic-nucleotide 2'-phosphodiesterase (5'-nucleotidase family)